MQTAPYHKRYTETQLEAGAGFILNDFNEEQVTWNTHRERITRGTKPLISLQFYFYEHTSTAMSVLMEYGERSDSREALLYVGTLHPLHLQLKLEGYDEAYT